VYIFKVRVVVRAQPVREFAARRNLTLGALAREVGSHPVTFSKYLAGHGQMGPRTRKALLRFIDAPFDEIFEIVDEAVAS